MNDTRRGFLKTLGKLAAAVGITTAACSAHHHGHHHPKHPKHPKRSDIPVSKETLLSQIRTLKAHSRTAPKAKTLTALTDEELQWVKDGRKVMEFHPPTVPKDSIDEKQWKYASNVCVTNRPDVREAVEMTSRHQEWLNRITMARIDNISMSLNPQILLKDLMPDNS